MKKINVWILFFIGMFFGCLSVHSRAEAPAPQKSHAMTSDAGEAVSSSKKGLVAVSKKATQSKKEKADRKKSASAGKNKVVQSSDLLKKKTLYPVDDIVVVIYAQEGTEIITQSDLNRPTLEGAPRTLDETIFERLLFLDAKKYKMTADEEAIDKHLATVQRQNNMTLDELKAVFKASGYTYEEGREQFGIMYAVNAVVDFKIRSRLIVPEKDVLAYYEANPVMLEPSYQVQRAVIPYGKATSKQELRKELANFKGVGLEWQEPFWVDQSDLAESKRFIIGMAVGAIGEPQEIDSGYEVVKLVDKKGDRLAPLEDRYREIVDILRKPKYDEVMADYKKTLFDSASIVYLRQESKSTDMAKSAADMNKTEKTDKQV